MRRVGQIDGGIGTIVTPSDDDLGGRSRPCRADTVERITQLRRQAHGFWPRDLRPQPDAQSRRQILCFVRNLSRGPTPYRLDIELHTQRHRLDRHYARWPDQERFRLRLLSRQTSIATGVHPPLAQTTRKFPLSPTETAALDRWYQRRRTPPEDKSNSKGCDPQCHGSDGVAHGFRHARHCRLYPYDHKDGDDERRCADNECPICTLVADRLCRDHLS